MRKGPEYGKLSEEPGLSVILFIKIPSSSNVYLSLKGRKGSYQCSGHWSDNSCIVLDKI